MMIRERQEKQDILQPVNRAIDGDIEYRLKLSSATQTNVNLGLW
jgi:hypothetical protein